MTKVSIIGIASYVGGELLRLIYNHHSVDLVHCSAGSAAGQQIADVFPHLRGLYNIQIENSADPAVIDQIIKDSELLFLIMGHGEAAPIAAKAVAAGKKVIDLGADLRFRKADIFEQWYNVPHRQADLTASAVYGLPEIYRQQIKTASAVGNPGCYPTATILGLNPLLKNKLIDTATIIIDAKSGTSGAGRKPVVGSLFSEVNSSFKAYGVANHRHTPEIEQVLSDLAGCSITLNFTPHLVPMTRGIYITAYANLISEISGEELTDLYKKEYNQEYFVHVQPHGKWPESKYTLGSNFCCVGVTADQRTGRAIVCSVIDNLVKGAAGQAIQNLNVMSGYPENTALQMAPLYP